MFLKLPPELLQRLLLDPTHIMNCIVLGRAEAFAAKNNALSSMFDGIGMGLGFTIALIIERHQEHILLPDIC